MFDAWLVSARLAQYLGLMSGFGLAVFVLHALQREHAGASITMRVLRVAGAASAVALVASLFGLWAMARSMSDGSAAGTWTTAQTLLTHTTVGTTWIIRVVLLIAIIGIAGLRFEPRRRIATVAVLGAGALATLAWTGHGAMSEGALAWVHLAVDIAHLVAAGAWIGALLALILIARHTRGGTDDETVRLLAATSSGFAGLGSIIVATLVVTGIVNYVLVVGPTVSQVITTPYGWLLLTKLALFAGMLVLASANRFRFVPALVRAFRDNDTPVAVATLRRSLWTEASLALAVLAVVSWLGSLNPTE